MRKPKTLLGTAVKAACLALMAWPVQAQDLSDMVEVTVLPGWRADDGSHMAALHLDLGPGWKTYWRAPGDAGIPPVFNWYGSRNVARVDVQWPSPKVVPQFGYLTIGYDQDVILPLRVTPTARGGDAALKGRIEIGVCKDVCVPITVNVAQDLPKVAKNPDPSIVAALAARPFTASEAGVRGVECRLSPAKDGLALTAKITMPKLSGSEMAVFEPRDSSIWVAPAKTKRQGNTLVAQTTLQHVQGRSFALDRSALRITVLGQGSAVDIQGCSAG
ncbi:MAG: protein-disulfide reductase DsbD domain-containing protein [Pseudomonadota bacterium]